MNKIHDFLNKKTDTQFKMSKYFKQKKIYLYIYFVYNYKISKAVFNKNCIYGLKGDFN